MHPDCEIAMWMGLSFQPEKDPQYLTITQDALNTFDSRSLCVWDSVPSKMRVPCTLSDGHPSTTGICLALMIDLRLFSFPGAMPWGHSSVPHTVISLFLLGLGNFSHVHEWWETHGSDSCDSCGLSSFKQQLIWKLLVLRDMFYSEIISLQED